MHHHFWPPHSIFYSKAQLIIIEEKTFLIFLQIPSFKLYIFVLIFSQSFTTCSTIPCYMPLDVIWFPLPASLFILLATGEICLSCSKYIYLHLYHDHLEVLLLVLSVPHVLTGQLIQLV
jgi:hypothetical protein